MVRSLRWVLPRRPARGGAVCRWGASASSAWQQGPWTHGSVCELVCRPGARQPDSNAMHAFLHGYLRFCKYRPRHFSAVACSPKACGRTGLQLHVSFFNVKCGVSGSGRGWCCPPFLYYGLNMDGMLREAPRPVISERCHKKIRPGAMCSTRCAIGQGSCRQRLPDVERPFVSARSGFGMRIKEAGEMLPLMTVCCLLPSLPEECRNKRTRALPVSVFANTGDSLTTNQDKRKAPRSGVLRGAEKA